MYIYIYIYIITIIAIITIIIIIITEARGGGGLKARPLRATGSDLACRQSNSTDRKGWSTVSSASKSPCWMQPCQHDFAGIVGLRLLPRRPPDVSFRESFFEPNNTMWTVDHTVKSLMSTLTCNAYHLAAHTDHIRTYITAILNAQTSTQTATAENQARRLPVKGLEHAVEKRDRDGIGHLTSGQTTVVWRVCVMYVPADVVVLCVVYLTSGQN